MKILLSKIIVYYEYNISFLVLDPCSEGCETRRVYILSTNKRCRIESL